MRIKYYVGDDVWFSPVPGVGVQAEVIATGWLYYTIRYEDLDGVWRTTKVPNSGEALTPRLS